MDKAVALFDPDTLADDLTPGGLRYLTHAIRPGTPIASAAVLTFSGKVRLKPTGPWMPFRATETIHAGCSFRVTANARRGPIRATIEDTYDSTGARARVHAFGIIPVRSQSGPGPHPFAPGLNAFSDVETESDEWVGEVVACPAGGFGDVGEAEQA